VAARQAIDHGGDVGFGIEAVELCGFRDGVDDGGALAASV